MRLPQLLALAAVTALGLGFGLPMPAPQAPQDGAPRLAAAKAEPAAPRDLRPLKFSL